MCNDVFTYCGAWFEIQFGVALEFETEGLTPGLETMDYTIHVETRYKSNWSWFVYLSGRDGRRGGNGCSAVLSF